MPDTRSEIEAVAASLPSDDSQSSTPESTPVTPSESATPATQETGTPQATAPVTSDDDESSLPSVGAIPVDRVKKIIENARRKASTEVEGRFAWTKDLTQEQYHEQKQILSWLDSDPIGFHKFVENQLKSDPRYASQFTPPPQPKADPEPKPDLMLDDGTLTFSADQLGKLFSWRERQLETKVTERFAPIENAFRDQAARHAGITKAQEVLNDASAWPGFVESAKEIAALMESDKRVTLESAYRRVAIPKMQAKDKDLRESLRKEILNELKSKPAASTEVPGRVTTSPPESTKGRSTEDVMRSVLAEMGG